MALNPIANLPEYSQKKEPTDDELKKWDFKAIHKQYRRPPPGTKPAGAEEEERMMAEQEQA